ncbi:MAG: hypothetical protein IJK84_07435 [Bacteroidales bacterium]|nr:hypothetical protein [Bacteroidales bacterium]
MKKIISLGISLLLSTCLWAQAQADYIPEQLGRDSHHIIQGLGAFVGNERAESQAFDITYMPAGNDVDGIMIINTADYRLTFKLDKQYDLCYELLIDIRSQDFLNQFYNLFSVYRTENMDNYRIMHFGNEKLRVTENPSTTSKYRSFKITVE